MSIRIIIILISTIFFLSNCFTEKINKSYIKVENGEFIKNKKKYLIAGTNYWYGSNLAAQGKEGRERIKRELDFLKSIGVNNLRVQACSEGGDEIRFGVKPSLQPQQGIYNEELFDGLDFFLNELAKREITAVLALNNYWSWTGGMAKYVQWNGGDSIPYPSSAVPGSWKVYMEYAAQFYTNKDAVEAFRKHIKVMLNRKNKYSGVLYKNDPTIMAWQLANEPRGGRSVEEREVFINWIHETSAYLKSIDTNHLVTTGSEGSVGHHRIIEDFEKANNCKSIDYLTYHLWPQNWGWYNPEKPDSTIDRSIELAEQYIEQHEAIAKKLNKPAVLEEFGLARDYGYFTPDSSAAYKEQFFNWVFNKIANLAANGGATSGSNFWGWSGEGKIASPGEFWQPGDDFIGDPPHEAQGWYAIFQTDSTMVEVIEKYAKKMHSINSTTAAVVD